jgi:hypothetical protein
MLRWCIVTIICGLAVVGSLTSTASWAAPNQPTTDEGTAGPKDSYKVNVRACPGIKLIDCMPAVSGRTKILCDPETVKWIKENCPDVLVVY